MKEKLQSLIGTIVLVKVDTAVYANSIFKGELKVVEDDYIELITTKKSYMIMIKSIISIEY